MFNENQFELRNDDNTYLKFFFLEFLVRMRREIGIVRLVKSEKNYSRKSLL